jgi:hypothetical protein
MGNGEAGILNKPLRVVASPSLKRLPPTPYCLLPIPFFSQKSLHFKAVDSSTNWLKTRSALRQTK